MSELSSRILEQAKNDLVLEMPPLARAFTALKMCGDFSLNNSSVKGMGYFYSPELVCRSFASNGKNIARSLLHSVLHCIFMHSSEVAFCNRQYRDLAVDITVENTINTLNLKCTYSFKQKQQEAVLGNIKKNVKSITSNNLYDFFSDGGIKETELKLYKELFCDDSHDCWYENGKIVLLDDDEMIKVEAASIYKFNDDTDDNEAFTSVSSVPDNNSFYEDDSKEQWKEIAGRIKSDISEHPPSRGIADGFDIQGLTAVLREKYDYSSFLSRFISAGKSLQINDSEFDYIYYTYGLKLYGNIPLIEPLEYTDNAKIHKIIIAIDTSGSVKGMAVQRFMEKTFSVLKTAEYFSRDAQVHIIQCDSDIRDVAVIHNENELQLYVDSVKLTGFGGTDFRPVFEYAKKLSADGSAAKLDGLIYFSDGDGVYPEKMPDFKVAFIISDNGFDKKRLPIWITPLYFSREN